MKLPITNLTKEKENQLISKLRGICNCDHFVGGILIDLKSDEDADKVLDYIVSNPELESSEIIVFVLLLKREREQNTTKES